MKKICLYSFFSLFLSSCSYLFYDGQETIQDEILQEVSSSSDHISIELADQISYLYNGIDNVIQIHCPEGTTDIYEVSVSNGSIVKEDTKNGLYYFYEDRINNVVIDFQVTHKETGKSFSKAFQLRSIPAPKAYLWKYRVPLPIQRQNVFTSVDKKTINALILDIDNPNLPLRCNAISYHVDYISIDDTRKTFKNESKTGVFSEELLKTIQESKSGDLFIFDDISSNCSSSHIRPIFFRVKK